MKNFENENKLINKKNISNVLFKHLNLAEI